MNLIDFGYLALAGFLAFSLLAYVVLDQLFRFFHERRCNYDDQ